MNITLNDICKIYSLNNKSVIQIKIKSVNNKLSEFKDMLR